MYLNDATILAPCKNRITTHRRNKIIHLETNTVHRLHHWEGSREENSLFPHFPHLPQSKNPTGVESGRREGRIVPVHTYPSLCRPATVLSRFRVYTELFARYTHADGLRVVARYRVFFFGGVECEYVCVCMVCGPRLLPAEIGLERELQRR